MHPGDRRMERDPRSRRNVLAAGFLLALAASGMAAFAGGPRFVTGTAFGATGPGGVMAFYTPQLRYFTDPGDLSSSVPHAQADAMVAAASSVWNVPYASVALTQGGALAEHLSSSNAYFNGTRMVFPADASASNYATIPIAVIYDTDGSVTDQLLGSGASTPAGCRQNGVTNIVDGFSQYGQIQHAVLLINGRCAGPAPEQLTQLEYQTMRAFGRVLGLAWSQLNDNVFTGSRTPSANDMANWPVMHPLDIVCSLYTYQCMQNPFSLRLDDISALAQLYPVSATNPATGKIATLAGSDSMFGQIWFPNGGGMEMVNVTVKRLIAGTSYLDPSQMVSGVSGATFQANGGNRVAGGESSSLNAGWVAPSIEGLFSIGRLPLGGALSNLFVTTESINPLYTGSYALGIFQRPVAVMSGSPTTAIGELVSAGLNYLFLLTQTGSAATCAPGSDGVEAAPAAADPSGLWLGQLCGVGHQSWFTASVQAGRTWTIETTALDESGNATLQKAQPVLGVWNSADPAYVSFPTVASSPFAMNALAAGVTQIHMPAAATNSSYRVVVEDQFGAGRPDFTYRARVLYASIASPATVGQGGGLLTITGRGFLSGNQVLVNGVRATVTSTTATQITAIAPAITLTGASVGTPLDVEVLDAHTGGSSTIPGAVSYTNAPDLIQTVSAPASLLTGFVAATPFAVKVLTSDGLASVAGAAVSFTVTQGSATLGCGSATCTITTDSSGVASTTLLGMAAGVIAVTATEVSGGNSASITLQDTTPTLSLLLAPSTTAYLAAGASAAWTLTATAQVNGLAATSVPIVWSATGPGQLAPLAGSTGAAGTVSATVGVTSATAGEITIQACAWTSVCATWEAIAVAPTQWTPVVTAGAGQSVPQTSPLTPVTVSITDGLSHALPGATATVYQEVEAWEGPCPLNGPCPAAPVLAKSIATVTADSAGNVTVLPLTVPDQPQTVHIAIATGTQGFLTLTVVKTP